MIKFYRLYTPLTHCMFWSLAPIANIIKKEKQSIKSFITHTPFEWYENGPEKKKEKIVGG